MKVLIFVDLHGSKKALKKIKEKASKADLILCAGDLSIFEQNLDFLLFELNKLKKPVYVIHGNHEDEKVLKDLTSMFDNISFIHDKVIEKEGFSIIGFGGGGFSLVDKGFEKSMQKLMKKVKDNNKLILVTHAPPHNTKVDLILEEHCGNKSITSFIKKHKPIIAISGHLHETAGKKDKIKETIVINPGPFGELVDIETS